MLPPLPGVASREIPAEMHYTLEGGGKAIPHSVLKKTECALSESGIKTCTALTGPSLKPSPHLPPYFSPAVTPDGLHFTNSYFMEMVGENGAEPCNNNNDY